MTLQEQTVLILSPEGKDTNDGVSAPLATLNGAFAQLEKIHNEGKLRLPARIVLKEGVYRLAETLRLSTTFPLTIEGEAGKTVVIDGGMEPTDWKPVTVNGRKAWSAAVPRPVHQMYFQGKVLQRASFPKSGFYRAQDERAPWANLFSGSNRFTVENGSFDPTWYNPKGVEIKMIHKWIEEHLPVESFDAATQTLTSTHTSTFTIAKDDTEYRVENVREALLEPGEFYYDDLEKTVIVIPDADFETTAERPAIPLVGCFLQIVGARFLTLRNLHFRHGGAWRPACTLRYDMPGDFCNHAIDNDEGWSDENSPLPHAAAPQGAVQVPGLLFLYQSTDCDIQGCTVENSGWYGIEVSSGCRNIRLERNHLHHLGGGGVRIGGASVGKPAELQTSRVVVTDNHIHDCGLIYMSACGVAILHAYGNLVEHNHIHDLYYTGVSAGWIWGFRDSVARENRIGWNLIHDLGKGILSDMGGIYLLGIQPGTRVYCNYIANIVRRYYGGWGIYTDEGSSHIVVENNICTDCSSEAYHQHYGRENTLRWNIFAFGNDGVLRLSRGNEHMNFYPGENFSNALASYNNVFVSAGKPFICSGTEQNLTIPTFISENGVFFNAEGDKPPLAAAGEWSCTLKEWQARGFDRTAYLADPGFTDLKNRDFSFGPDSLLAKLKFPQLDRAKVGVRPLEDE